MTPRPTLTFDAAARVQVAIAAVVAGTGLAVLAQLVDAVPEHDGWTTVDSPVARWFALHRDGAVDGAALAIGQVTVPVLVAALAALVAVALWIRGRRHEPLLLVGSVGLAMATSLIVKVAVGRPRPLAPLNLTPESEPSFPSGHVLVLTTAVLVGLVLAWPALHARGRILATAATVAAVAVICADRLVIDAHWLTDVVASLTIAAVIAAVVVAIRAVLPPRPAVVGAGDESQ